MEKPKGPSRRSSRAEKDLEEEPLADSGIRKRSARPGTSAAVKGNIVTNTTLKKKHLSLHIRHKLRHNLFSTNKLAYCFRNCSKSHSSQTKEVKIGTATVVTCELYCNALFSAVNPLMLASLA